MMQSGYQGFAGLELQRIPVVHEVGYQPKTVVD